VIAVKKLFQLQIDSDDQIKKQVSYLVKLKHQNILQLIGYCAESKDVRAKRGGYDMAEVQEKLLCFEYLNNRTLLEHISGMVTMEHAYISIILTKEKGVTHLLLVMKQTRVTKLTVTSFCLV
jgi:hypothetical protein